MDKETGFEIPTKTINLFSWDYLKKHRKTRPIIRKYFGEIGAELFKNTGREFYGTDDILDEQYRLNSVNDFIYEINQIPPQELLDDNVFNADHIYDTGEASELFYDLPYGLMVSTPEDKQLAIKILAVTDSESVLPNLWRDAMDYIHWYNKRKFNLNIDAGNEALVYYRAKLAVDRLGIKGTRDFLEEYFSAKFFGKKAKHFSQEIGLKIGEKDFDSKFLKQEKPRVVDVMELDDFDSLFAYPEWIEFTSEAHIEIFRRILYDEMTDAQMICYFSSLPKYQNYVNLYPVVKHVAMTTNNIDLLSTLWQITDDIWGSIPVEDKALQDWFRGELYDTYWVRIGDIWPIKHYQKITLRYNRQAVFDFALNWIMTIDNVGDFNPELKLYLESFEGDDMEDMRLRLLPEPVWKRCIDMELKKCTSPKEQRERAIKLGGDSAEIWRRFCYPSTIEQAEDFLESFILEKDRFDKMDLLEELLITGNYPTVGAFIIQWLTDNLHEWGEELYYNDIIDIFTAACMGATEYDELEPLKRLANKCRRIKIPTEKHQSMLETISSALKLARKNVELYSMQRNEVSKNLCKHAREVEQQLSKEKGK